VLAEDVLRFLRSSIDSLWALDVLLLLRREPSRRRSVEELTAELRASRGIVINALVQLGRAGLIEEAEGLYRYHPLDAEGDALIERVAASYANFPVAVTRAVLTAPSHKIQLFADAFRLKKD
jgi:hypothetical protein